MYKAKQRMKTLLLACFAALVSMLLAVALWVTPTSKIDASAATTTVEDTLNRATTGISGTSYSSWSDKTDKSTAVYAGQSAGGNDSIQLRSKNNNSGIITTASGGKVAKISVEWNSNTTSGRILQIYGKNTAYTAASELYDVNTQGTKLGDIKYGTSTELTVSGDYQYVGMKSSDGAMYLTSVSIVWELSSSTCDTCTYDSYTYTDNGDGTHAKKGTCTVCKTEATIIDKENCNVEIWSDYTTENGQHTRSGQCKLCEATVTETGTCEVSTGEYVREENKHSQTGTCSICGDSTTVVEDCTLSYVNVSNENGTHNMTSTCSVCEQSATTENVDCTFDEGVLDGTTLTYTCEYCGYSYTEETTMYTVTYVVPDGVNEVTSATVADGYTTELPKANDYDKYTFVGWVDTKLAEDKTTAPDYFKANEEYTVNADITLYALYSYEKESVNAESWNLVADAATLAVGKEIVIVASGSNYAMGEDNGNNRTAVNVTKSSDKSTIELTVSIQVITLEEGKVDGTFAFNVGNGYLYAASSSSNYLKTKATLDNNGSWSITVDSEGIATIKAQGTYTRNWLRKNSNSTLFACYSSGQSDISIYMKSGGTITYYATPIVEEGGHEHAYDEGVVTPPTCTEEGYTTYTCECGDTYKDNYEEATGHSYEESITQAATCTEAGVKTFTCSVCADTYTEVIPALGHNFVDGTCDNCGEAQPIKATLTFDDTAKRTDFSTSSQIWKENGITVTNNKASSTNNVANYSNPVRFYKNSTVTIEWTGMKVIVLNSSSGDYAKDLETSLTEGTVTKNGTVFTIVLDEAEDSYTFTCAGQVRLNSIAVYSQEAHIDSATITIGEDTTMNYYVTMPDIFASAAMYFVIEGITEPIIAESKLAADGRYVFSLEIPPHLMASNISAKLKLGEQILASRAAYSVKTYAENKLNAADSSDELKQLVIDMLHYGAAAQNYKGYNTENLATAGLTEEQKASASKAAPESTDFTLTKNGEIASYPAYFLGAGVYFDNVNKIYVKLSTTENVTLTINGVAVEVTGDTVYTDGILATGFAETYTFVLSCNGEEMQTLTYSVNAYVYAMKGKGNAMADLAIALYNYGESAKAYKA